MIAEIVDLMKQKEAKFAELDTLIARVGVLNIELQDLQRAAMRGFPSRLQFPACLGAGITAERIEEALLAVIGKRDQGKKSLTQRAEEDTRWVENMGKAVSDEWGV